MIPSEYVLGGKTLSVLLKVVSFFNEEASTQKDIPISTPSESYVIYLETPDTLEVLASSNVQIPVKLNDNSAACGASLTPISTNILS